MHSSTAVRNWAIGHSPDTLEYILNNEVNIAIYERSIDPFQAEIDRLIDSRADLRVSGNIDTILDQIISESVLGADSKVLKDIQSQLDLFQEITGVRQFRLLLAVVNSNMCRRFHSDVNDLRLLCTYSGPGTLWLENENVNRKALNCHGGNEDIVLNEEEIRQATTGSVVLLKGSRYPQRGIEAIVHRSPTIEESRINRLLLRIDTN
ncbi:MAG: DUF1826 domain-containing protein [Flavobacteriales bacterium]|nr:DUF1826 domain-containing protein [Flavobacteriales bacterium]